MKDSERETALKNQIKLLIFRGNDLATKRENIHWEIFVNYWNDEARTARELIK